ncbi:hypothetical protein Nepgr_023496 [Nepenthes gracilis]|uniref:Uncharacterized protein n=1 Tax=Nepenthes gracilis TaxID=150966 RepID=A0AAD3T2Y4_NEPGR|nr:hypothetical protein Nepgr_023496 [Nepenthes gracilis]
MRPTGCQTCSEIGHSQTSCCQNPFAFTNPLAACLRIAEDLGQAPLPECLSAARVSEKPSGGDKGASSSEKSIVGMRT